MRKIIILQHRNAKFAEVLLIFSNQEKIGDFFVFVSIF